MNDVKSHELKGKKLYGQLNVLDGRIPYDTNSKLAGEYYRRATYMGVAFPVTVEFGTKYDNGELNEVTIIQKEETVDLADGTSSPVTRYSIGGSLTHKQIASILDGMTDARIAEVKYESITVSDKLSLATSSVNDLVDAEG